MWVKNMKSTVTVIAEIAIVLLCIGIIYSLTNGFTSFSPASLAERAKEMIGLENG